MEVIWHQNKKLLLCFILLFLSFQSIGSEPKKDNISIFKIIILEYIRVTMDEYNQPLSKEKMDKVHYESALAYVNYLKSWFKLNKGVEVRTERINFNEAKIINENGFKAAKLPYDAWFFADIYDVFDENERNKFWREMNSNSERESEEKIFVDLWFKMRAEAESTSIEKRKKSQRWLKRMRKIPLVIEIEKTMTMVEDSFRYKK